MSTIAKTTKRILFTLIVFAGLIGCALMFLPSIISTSWGKKQLLTFINQETSYVVTIKDISISWFGPQTIEGIEIKSTNGQMIASVEKINTASSLIKLIWNPTSAEALNIEKLDANLGHDTKLNNIHITTTSSSLYAVGDTQQGSLIGGFTIDIILNGINASNLLKLNGDWDKLLSGSSNAELKIAAEVNHFPVGFLDQFLAFNNPQLAGMLKLLLGEELNINIKQSATSKGIIVDLNATSPKLSLSELSFKIDDNIELTKGASLKLLVPHRLIEELFNDSPSNPGLTGAEFVSLTLQKFSLPLTALGRASNFQQLIARANIQAEISLPLFNFENMPMVKKATVDDFKIAFISSPESQFQTNLSLLLTLPDYKPSQTIPLNLSITQLKIPNHIENLSSLRMSGVIKTGEIVIPSPDKQPSSTLKDFSMNWEIDGPDNLIALRYNGVIDLIHEAAGKISGTAYIKNLFSDSPADMFIEPFDDELSRRDPIKDPREIALADKEPALLHIPTTNTIAQIKPVENRLEKPFVQFHVDLHKLPVKILSNWLQQPDLILMIGNSIEMGLEGNLFIAKEPTGHVNVTVNSPLMSGSSHLTINNNFQLQIDDEPTKLNFVLTPNGYNSFKKVIEKEIDNDFVLAQNATARLVIKKLSLPLITPFPYLHAAVDGAITIDHLTGLSNKSNQTLSLNDVNISIASEDISKMTTLIASADGQVNQNTRSSWNINGSAENLLTAEGVLNHDSSISFKASLKNIPISMLCYLICSPKLGQQVHAVIGPTLNAELSAQLKHMDGPIFADIRGNNGHILADTYLNKGILTLRKNLDAQVKITEDLGNVILQNILPVANKIKPSDQPVKLTIDREGFAVPIWDFNILTTEIPRFTLELGKVHFSNRSELAKVLSLLTTVKTDELSVWVTPAYFSLSKGTIKLERVDLLINETYPIASWGTVDIGDDKVRMTIGLSGNAISKAFGLTNIPNGYMLQLPLRGTLDSASIDVTKATARISALVAQTQGGVPGLVIGTVLDLANGSMKTHATPPPTTKPLPWQNLLEGKELPKEGAKKADASSQPLEEIGKKASSVIKQFFQK